MCEVKPHLQVPHLQVLARLGRIASMMHHASASIYHNKCCWLVGMAQLVICAFSAFARS
jgi:hypothetical protein